VPSVLRSNVSRRVQSNAQFAVNTSNELCFIHYATSLTQLSSTGEQFHNCEVQTIRTDSFLDFSQSFQANGRIEQENSHLTVYKLDDFVCTTT
jgi:hypothetical protein